MNFYDLVDSGEGRRLERFGDYLLDRPDPQIIWKKSLSAEEWGKADAFFQRTKEDKGTWIINTSVPEKWKLEYNGIEFLAKLSPFKHTGVFPEQAVQWEYIADAVKGKNAHVLHLFAYTGIATLFAARSGARVTHVDASKPAIDWANENRKVNGMDAAPIRWIIDDALAFTAREMKRGITYDAIIMDPPVYGHGPKGEVWDFNRDFPKLLANCKQLVSPNPLFVLVNAYAISSSSITLANTLNDYFETFGGHIENGELTLKETSAGRLLSTGIWARWSK
jgi:23S rRNA (cytosine1962-C5)-methyltransferase